MLSINKQKNIKLNLNLDLWNYLFPLKQKVILELKDSSKKENLPGKTNLQQNY